MNTDTDTDTDTAGDALPVRLALFAKAPVPGYAKTRLIPRLGAAGAAALAAGLIARTLALAAAVRPRAATLWCAPEAAHPAFTALVAPYPQLARRSQADGDLGARMHAAFVDELAHGPTLLIGCDCPPLAPAHLHAAARALLGDATQAPADAVFLPAEDGGYVLIGLHRPQPALFAGMPWSTPALMAATRARLHAAGLAWREPATLWDLDRPADYARWRAATGPAAADRARPGADGPRAQPRP